MTPPAYFTPRLVRQGVEIAIATQVGVLDAGVHCRRRHGEVIECSLYLPGDDYGWRYTFRWDGKKVVVSRKPELVA